MSVRRTWPAALGQIRSWRLPLTFWKVCFPLTGALLAELVVLRRLFCEPGYLIYRDAFPGQLFYSSLWSPQGSFLAFENYKYATYTGLFLPLRALGLEIFEKAVYASVLALAYLAMYLAVYRLAARLYPAHLTNGESVPKDFGLAVFAGTAAAWMYIANPAAANLYFDFSLYVGYACAPLILLIFMEALAGYLPRLRGAVFVGILWWLSAIKAHWIVFGGLLLLPAYFCWLLWRARRNGRVQVLRNSLVLAGAVLLYLLLSAYWLAPFVQASQARFVGSYAPMTHEALRFLSYTPLEKAVRMLGLFPAWPYVRFDPPPGGWAILWELGSWVFPGLALWGLLRHRRRWQAWTLACLALGGVLLAKGVAPPLGDLYDQLVFGPLTPESLRWLLRVSSKWIVFASLGYSTLAGLAVYDLAARTLQSRPAERRRQLYRLAIWLGAAAGLLLVWAPSFSGDFNGAWDPVPLPPALQAANQWLANQPAGTRLNWMPVTNGRELSWNPRPSGDFYTALSEKPSIGSNWNRNPVLFLSYAYDALVFDRTQQLGKLLSALGLNTVVFHDDIVTPHMHAGVEPVSVLIEASENELPPKFAAQDDLRLAWKQDFVSIYQSPEAVQELFVPAQVYLATGDLPLLTSLSALPGYEPTQQAILFDASRLQGWMPQDVQGLILGKDAAHDLMFSQLPPERMISLAAQTRYSSAVDQWGRFDIYQYDWQSLLRSYDIYAWGFDYGLGTAIQDARERLIQKPGSASPTLSVPMQVATAGEHELWLRALRNPFGGEVALQVDGEPLARLTVASPAAGFAWELAGEMNLTAGRHTLSIQAPGGLAILNAAALLTPAERRTLEQEAASLAAAHPNLYWLEAEADFERPAGSLLQDVQAFSGGRAVHLSDGGSLSTGLDLAAAGEYNLAVRARSNQTHLSLKVELGEQVLPLVFSQAAGQAGWSQPVSLRLPSGPLKIRLQAESEADLDALAIFPVGMAATPLDLFSPQGPPAEISYTAIGPGQWRVRVRASRPFFLALAETYDPLWTVVLPEGVIHSLPLNSAINGFYIPRSGEFELTVEYQAQQSAWLGALFTAAVAVSVLLLGLFLRARGRSGDPR